MTLPKTLPDYKHLHEIFEYRDGGLYRRVERGNQPKGSFVGYPNGKGYLVVKISGKKYKVARVIWKMVYGSDPENYIDHINGIKDDNRIDNLRDVTAAENNNNKYPYNLWRG